MAASVDLTREFSLLSIFQEKQGEQCQKQNLIFTYIWELFHNNLE